MPRVQLIGVALVAALSSCSTLGVIRPTGRPVSEVAGEGDGKTLRVLDGPSPLRRDGEIPVLAPPEVLALYVPSHLDRERDLLVGEHWVFVKLRDAEWFVEKLQAEPRVEGKAGEAELKPLQKLEFEKVLVPFKAK